MKSIRSQLILVFSIAFALSYLIITKSHRTQELHKSFNPFKAPPLVSLSPNLINIVTLGHQNVYHDFITIWLLQTLMDQQIPREPERMMVLIRSVLRHQPRLETSYMLSCIIMFDEFKHPEECQEISLLGLKAFPQSWRIPMLQGYVHAVLLKEPAQAAAFFNMAASRPHRPSWVQRLVSKLTDSSAFTEDDLQQSIQILSRSPQSEEFSDLLYKMQVASQQQQSSPSLESGKND